MTNAEALNLVIGEKVIYRNQTYRVCSVRKIRDNSPEIEVFITRKGRMPIFVLATYLESL